MAEPFGIVSGAVGIAAVFTTCVDVFEYIHLGRRFGKDYQTNQLQLTLLRLRLSRWGQAVDIYRDPQLGNPTATPAEIQTAKDTLLQILVLFEDSNRISKKFAITTNDNLAPPAQDAASELEVAALNNRMRDMAVKRRKGTSLLKVTAWALHHGAAFDTLITQIRDLIEGLENLLPAPTALRDLAKQEVADIKAPQEVEVLKSVSTKVDPLFYEAASQIHGNVFRNLDIDAGKDGNVLNGNYYAPGYQGVQTKGASNLFDGVKIKGTEGLVNLNGDNVGGVDPFARLARKT
jgi:Prion-inhibition and propagation